jgi:putative Mn2+ efflux pump MntP
VGVSFSFLKRRHLGPALLIGVVTFVSRTRACSSVTVAPPYEKKVEMLGGLILIGIGVKILVEHLTA